jgi:hypothetical protein
VRPLTALPPHCTYNHRGLQSLNSSRTSSTTSTSTLLEMKSLLLPIKMTSAISVRSKKRRML